ncbi:WD40-repeat-containing domain protein [Polychytrium aggregatum]|uniref:WD40-repeat-containing domain protein n=1 Tax=Polychytrium aggregatum TaxID=110093 RepID=UPI0022FED706|nr:WD40-repeat-containing domain protein [Polychytrium aggregatum]KAI9193422.1 WD40-repeat-containing domain protein [Polychytrium aggregatum]
MVPPENSYTDPASPGRDDADSADNFVTDDLRPEEVTPEDIAQGHDIQGLKWSEIQRSRTYYRDQRIVEYRNYKNLDIPYDRVEEEIARVRTDGQFYKFRYTRLSQVCTIVHFQLRNLIWATSKNDVYYIHNSSVRHWCPLSKRARSVLKVHSHIRISTMCAKMNYLIAGGYQGEFVLRSLNEGSAEKSGAVSPNRSNGITNHIDIVESRSGVHEAIISSNDEFGRVMNLDRGEIVQAFRFDWALNCSARSPDQKRLCVVGDVKDSLIVDSQTGQTLETLTGHIDYSFACAWSPCGRFVVTGNQDCTARLYDTRNLQSTLATFSANLGAVRSLRFSDDGQFLAMAESADFVHLFDLRSHCAESDYRSQVIDFFGEIGGVCFTPGDAEGLFIGVAAQQSEPGSIIEFERRRPSLLSSLSDL